MIMGGTMRIELSKQQYEKLVRLVMTGNWVINACKEDDDIIQEYEDLEQHIFSYHERYEIADIIASDDDGILYPTKDLEDEVAVFVDGYVDDVFFDKLTDCLVIKEAFKKYADPTQKQLLEIYNKYEEEFKKNGTDRLCIDWNNNRK
jgi:hypothetical protein